MSGKKEHYVYLGYYMNLKIFYNTKDQNIYPDVNPDASAIPVTIFAGMTCIFYAMGRCLHIGDLLFSNTIKK